MIETMIYFGVVAILFLTWSRLTMPYDKRTGIATLTVGVVMLLATGLVLKGVISKASSIKSPTPINPTIKIECTNNKCDTTYIYKLK